MNVTKEIQEVLETTVGGSVLSRGEIASYIASDSAAVFVLDAGNRDEPDIRRVTGDTSVETVAGVSIAREFSEMRALSEHPYLHSNPAELLENTELTEKQFPVGSVLVTGIVETYQGDGFGQRLSFTALEFLLTNEVTPVVQLEWDRPDNSGVEKLKQLGYSSQVRLENHFPAGWDCPPCASDTTESQCTCDVVVFLL